MGKTGRFVAIDGNFSCEYPHIPNVDVYISGSNSRFLSREIVTEFRDRGDEIHVFPLSFREFYAAANIADLNDAIEQYIQYGGMPVVLSRKDPGQKEQYLKNLVEMTYTKDVIEHNKIRKTQELSDMLRVLAGMTGSLINAQKITDTFHSKFHSQITLPTIQFWLNCFEEAYILTQAKRVDVRGRKQIGALSKYYFEDTGLRNAVLNFLQRDRGSLMENIIFNELRCRGYSVNIGIQEVFSKNKEGVTVRKTLETDFLAEKGSKILYIQAAWNLDSEKLESRERRPLLAIDDSFKKIIIIRQNCPIHRDEAGILYLSLADFLLNENSLDF